MLPLWRNRVCIAISPERISLVKLGRGLKPKLLAQYDEAIIASVKQPSWHAAVEKLAQVLEQPEWQNSDSEIVLSNRLVRYAVIPSNTQLKKYAEREAFARHVLTQTYGTVTGQWALRIQCGKVALPWLVSAIDQSLLDRLKKICVGSKLTLRSIRPYLMPVFNRYHKVLKTDPAWLVIMEPGYALLALISDGALVAVSSATHNSASDLSVMLDRENLVATIAVPCKTVYLLAPAEGGLVEINKTEYTLNKLEIAEQEIYPSPETGLYAMAMSGLI